MIMAKDDYEVIVYRVLVYYYACMKRKIMFDQITFQEAVRKNVENDSYFADVLRMMQKEGLIEGIKVQKAWGGDYILNDPPKMVYRSTIGHENIHLIQVRRHGKVKNIEELIDREKEAYDSEERWWQLYVKNTRYRH